MRIGHQESRAGWPLSEVETWVGAEKDLFQSYHLINRACHPGPETKNTTLHTPPRRQLIHPLEGGYESTRGY